ncbi:MAG: two-component system sensor histidine kinase NtrB [Vicinamibacteria bacterium]
MRARLFLAFLVTVLVLVNSQSLQLSSQSRELLTASFEEGFESRARLLAAELSRNEAGLQGADGAAELTKRAAAHGLRSACVLDWNARLLTGGRCEAPEGGAFDRLDRNGKRRLLEEGWATTGISAPYDVNAAEATGYFVLRAESDEGSRAVLRVAMGAPLVAEANRRFRVTLVYQITALSFVLLAVILFFHSLLAPHRRLVAEARSVATELSADGAPGSRDEGQFLLDTFQEVVARLKEKEQQLSALHLLEKTRADETEALASDIIRSMTTGLVSLDPSGRVVVVNPAAERIFGIAAELGRGKPFREVFSGSAELTEMLEQALERGAYHLRGQARYRRGDGRLSHLGVSVIPLLSPQGKPKGALCLLADLTEVVELRERLFLKENLARLGEMAAGIAHEFRNGLATILGNAKLMKGSHTSADPIADAVIAESQSLARVVSEFLQFAKPEPLHLEPLDLGALVSELLDELRARAEDEGVALALSGEAVRLEADEPLLRKALTNLLANAIEALAESAREDRLVVVDVLEADGFALVRVRDNGPGIDPAHREKIFTPFFTLKERGTGLGLSVVQKIVVSHNGTVELEETASGASFLVRLPLSGAATLDSQDWI